MAPQFSHPSPTALPCALGCRLAYDDPASAPASSARLIGDEQREATADYLNGVILQAHGAQPTCAMERLLRQLIATADALRDANHGYGECLSLSANIGSRTVGPASSSHAAS